MWGDATSGLRFHSMGSCHRGRMPRIKLSHLFVYFRSRFIFSFRRSNSLILLLYTRAAYKASMGSDGTARMNTLAFRACKTGLEDACKPNVTGRTDTTRPMD